MLLEIDLTFSSNQSSRFLFVLPSISMLFSTCLSLRSPIIRKEVALADPMTYTERVIEVAIDPLSSRPISSNRDLKAMTDACRKPTCYSLSIQGSRGMEVFAGQPAENGHSGLGNGSSLSGPPLPSTSSLALNGRIEFHLARKPFTGFINSGGVDFRIETLNPDSGRKRPPDDLVPGGQPRRKMDGSDFLENGLDPELSFEISFRKIGAGLENLGNTCFLNSVLQCLTYTEPLAAYLQSGKHQNSCHIAGFCALCAIQKHVSRALQSTGRSLIPKDLVSNLRCISRNFRNARQEDAHEYMVNLLESMHKCCLPLGVPSESPAAYEKSLVHKIFGGRLRSQVECQQCFYCSNKFDPFLDLSLEIVKADSLPVALRNFTAAEMLDGGEKHYQCQHCKQKVRAKKRLTVHKVPYVLTIHLKRFHALDPGRKVNKKVLFDSSLDMKPFVSDSYDGNLKYSLYGVLVHFGHNTHSGHYVCFVRTSSGMWYLLNDNEVCQVSEKHVLEQKAYMLFYVRDRKNVALKKTIDVQKENIKSTFQNNANLVHRSFIKENSSYLVNGSAVTGHSATYKKDAWNVGPVKETFAKEASSQQNNEVMTTECSVPKQDPVLGPPSSAPLPKDMSKSGSPGGICTERAAGDISDEHSCDFSQGIACELVISSIPLVVPNECSLGEASESGRHKKSKKKLMKNQILRRHVGSNLFRASLGLWKKEKHKKNKKHILGTGNLMKEQLLDGSFPSELGPSTSKVSVSSVNSQMKGIKSVLEKGASPRKFGNVPVGDIINGELSERNNHAAENGNRDASQKGTMGVLFQDVVDIGVARWDGIVLPPSDTAEPSIAQDGSIGYVLDEWDEEYDRGKRKKLRHSKHNFGGPNPFQEIATEKTQFKKAKINRSSRGNQPFRI